MYNLLKNKRLILSLPLFLAASLLLPVYIVPLGHASPGTGLACITTSTSATSCPTSAPTIGPLTAGTVFTVGVFIQGSDAMGGFDIYVRSDPAFVNPTSAALGNLIASPSLTSICINGAATLGSCTVNTANGPGVVEVTTIESSGGNECGGISPCSGMAFFINYTVVASAASTPLSYPAAPGCAASSVSSPPNMCVLVADNVGTTIPENIQAATVIQTTSADFTITAVPNSVSVNAGRSAISNITLTSVNGLNGMVTLSTTPPPACPACPTWGINGSMIQLHAGGTNSSTLIFSTISSTPIGRWIVNVTGTFGSTSHTVTVVFTIMSSGPPPDFLISANPVSLIIPAGINASSTITLTSINGFSGMVQLSTTSPLCPQPQCTTWFVTPTQVSLAAGGSANAFLVIMAANMADSGTISISGTSGGLVHQTTVAFQVHAASTDFSLTAFPSFFRIPAGTTVSSQIQLYPNGFSGGSFSVALSAAVSPPNGLTATLNPTIVTLSSFSVYSTLTIGTLATTPVGNYTISVTGSSSGSTHSIIVYVQVLPPPTLKVTPTSGTVGAKVLVQGSGFPVEFGSSEIIVSFDDQLVGFIFIPTTSFNFTFNVPEAQAGAHTVKAFEPFFFSGSGSIIATAPFQVLQSPTGLTVSLDIGTIYFPGDGATAFILVNQNGQPASPADLQVTVQLIRPDGSMLLLTATKISTGIYRAVFTIPAASANPLGTYGMIANAHSSSLGDSTALGSFEVKPTWFAQNSKAITTGATLVGSVGVVGMVGLAWKKGYLKKKDDEQILPA